MLQCNRMRGRSYLRHALDPRFLRTTVHNNAPPLPSAGYPGDSIPASVIDVRHGDTYGVHGVVRERGTTADGNMVVGALQYAHTRPHGLENYHEGFTPLQDRALSSMGAPSSTAWLHTGARVYEPNWSLHKGRDNRRPRSTPPLARGLSSAPGASKDDTGSVEHRAASSVPDYGPVAMEEGEGAPEGMGARHADNAQAHPAPQDAQFAGHKVHKKLLHEEDVTAPFHGSGSGSGLAYGGTLSPRPGLTNGQRTAGMHADARLMAKSSQARVSSAVQSMPDPNLVMSKDSRYHNSFPRVPQFSTPASPHGLVPMEPLARAGAKVEAAVSYASHLAVALTRGVLDLGSTILGGGQGENHARAGASGRASSAPPSASAPGKGGFSVVPGDPSSANAPVTAYQKATNPATAAAHDPARMKNIPPAGPHPNASPDLHGSASLAQDRTPEDFGHEASGTAYLGPGAGQGVGAGAGVGAPDIPTRPYSTHTQDKPMSVASLSSALLGKTAPRVWSDRMRPSHALGHPSPSAGQGLVGQTRAYRSRAARHGPYEYGEVEATGPWAPFAMDGGLPGRSTSTAAHGSDPDQEDTAPPFFYGTKEGEGVVQQPASAVPFAETPPVVTMTESSSGQIEEVTRWDGTPIFSSTTAPATHILDYRVVQDPSLREGLGTSWASQSGYVRACAPSASGAWPSWVDEGQGDDKGWHGAEHGSLQTEAPITARFSSTDGAEPTTVAMPPHPEPAAAADDPAKAGTASYQPGITMDTEEHSQGTAQAVRTGDWATDGELPASSMDNSPYPPSYYKQHQVAQSDPDDTAEHPWIPHHNTVGSASMQQVDTQTMAPARQAKVDHAARVAPAEAPDDEEVEVSTLRVIANSTGHEELLQPYEEANLGAARSGPIGNVADSKENLPITPIHAQGVAGGIGLGLMGNMDGQAGQATPYTLVNSFQEAAAMSGYAGSATAQPLDAGSIYEDLEAQGGVKRVDGPFKPTNTIGEQGQEDVALANRRERLAAEADPFSGEFHTSAKDTFEHNQASLQPPPSASATTGQAFKPLEGARAAEAKKAAEEKLPAFMQGVESPEELHEAVRQADSLVASAAARQTSFGEASKASQENSAAARKAFEQLLAGTVGRAYGLDSATEIEGDGEVRPLPDSAYVPLRLPVPEPLDTIPVSTHVQYAIQDQEGEALPANVGAVGVACSVPDHPLSHTVDMAAGGVPGDAGGDHIPPPDLRGYDADPAWPSTHATAEWSTWMMKGKAEPATLRDPAADDPHGRSQPLDAGSAAGSTYKDSMPQPDPWAMAQVQEAVALREGAEQQAVATAAESLEAQHMDRKLVDLEDEDIPVTQPLTAAAADDESQRWARIASGNGFWEPMLSSDAGYLPGPSYSTRPSDISSIPVDGSHAGPSLTRSTQGHSRLLLAEEAAENRELDDEAEWEAAWEARASSPGDKPTSAVTNGPPYTHSARAGSGRANMPFDYGPAAPGGPGKGRRFSTLSSHGICVYGLAPAPSRLWTAAVGIHPFMRFLSTSASGTAKSPRSKKRTASPASHMEGSAVPGTRVQAMEEEEATPADIRAAFAAARLEQAVAKGEVSSGYVPSVHVEAVEGMAKRAPAFVEGQGNSRRGKGAVSHSGRPFSTAAGGDQSHVPQTQGSSQERGSNGRFMYPSQVRMSPEEERVADAEIERVHKASLGGADPNYNSSEWRVVDEGIASADVDAEVSAAAGGEGAADTHPRANQPMGLDGTPADVKRVAGPAISQHSVQESSPLTGHPSRARQGQVRPISTGRGTFVDPDEENAPAQETTGLKVEQPAVQGQPLDASSVAGRLSKWSRSSTDEEQQHARHPLVPPSWSANVERGAGLSPQVYAASAAAAEPVTQPAAAVSPPAGHSIFSHSARGILHPLPVSSARRMSTEAGPGREVGVMVHGTGVLTTSETFTSSTMADSIADEGVEPPVSVDFGPAPSIDDTHPDAARDTSVSPPAQRKVLYSQPLEFMPPSAASVENASTAFAADAGEHGSGKQFVDYGPAVLTSHTPAVAWHKRAAVTDSHTGTSSFGTSTGTDRDYRSTSTSASERASLHPSPYAAVGSHGVGTASPDDLHDTSSTARSGIAMDPLSAAAAVVQTAAQAVGAASSTLTSPAGAVPTPSLSSVDQDKDTSSLAFGEPSVSAPGGSYRSDTAPAPQRFDPGHIYPEQPPSSPDIGSRVYAQMNPGLSYRQGNTGVGLGTGAGAGTGMGTGRQGMPMPMDPISGLQVAATTVMQLLSAVAPSLPGMPLPLPMQGGRTGSSSSTPSLTGTLASMTNDAVQGAAAVAGATLAVPAGLALSAVNAAAQTLAKGAGFGGHTTTPRAYSGYDQHQGSDVHDSQQSQRARVEDRVFGSLPLPGEQAEPDSETGTRTMYQVAPKPFQDVQPRAGAHQPEPHSAALHTHTTHKQHKERQQVSAVKHGRVNVPSQDSE